MSGTEVFDAAKAEFRGSFIRDSLGLVTETELAAALGVEPSTLEKWRGAKGTGPQYVKLGKSVYYRREDLVVWIGSNVLAPGGVPFTGYDAYKSPPKLGDYPETIAGDPLGR